MSIDGPLLPRETIVIRGRWYLPRSWPHEVEPTRPKTLLDRISGRTFVIVLLCAVLFGLAFVTLVELSAP